MEKRLSLTVDGSNTESDMSELLEHQKQKIRKLTEQRNDEIEKYNTAQREYYELVQKSDRVSFDHLHINDGKYSTNVFVEFIYYHNL